jgi:hypothetical protein
MTIEYKYDEPTVEIPGIMRAFRQRLRRGNPTWLDQLIFRLPGLALLAGFWRLVALLIANARANPAIPQDIEHLALPMLVVLCLLSGLLLLFLGPGLLEEVPWPATSRYRPHKPKLMTPPRGSAPQ